MFGLDEVYTALNVSNITTLLDSYGSGKALFAMPLMPESFTGKKSINFYMIAPYSGADAISTYEFSINCRGSNFNDSITIAREVFNTINRKSYTDYFITCSLLQTIPPADSTDVYNTPVRIILKKR